MRRASAFSPPQTSCCTTSRASRARALRARMGRGTRRSSEGRRRPGHVVRRDRAACGRAGIRPRRTGASGASDSARVSRRCGSCTGRWDSDGGSHRRLPARDRSSRGARSRTRARGKASSSTSRSWRRRWRCSCRISSGCPARAARTSRSAAGRAQLEARADEIAGGVAMNPYYRCFEASDGFLAVACLNIAQRHAFLELFGLDDATVEAPDLVPGDPAVLAAKEELTDRIAQAFSARSVAEWIGRLEAVGVPCGPVQRREAVGGDAQVVAERLVGRDRAGQGSAPSGCSRRSSAWVAAPRACGRAVARRAHRGRPRGARMTFDVPAELSLFARVGACGARRLAVAARARTSAPGRTTATTSSQAGSPTPAGASSGPGRSSLGAAVAGGIELGRAAAPVSLVDEATLGAPLWVEGRARHGRSRRDRSLCRSTAAASRSGRRQGRPVRSRRSTGAARSSVDVEASGRPRAGRRDRLLACVERCDARVPRGTRGARPRARGRARPDP